MHSFNNWMICVAFLCGYSLLAACGSDDRDARQVHLMVANHTSPIQLADASDYLIRGVVIGSPQRAVIDRDTGLAYMVSEVRIAEVLAQRPDVLTQLTSSMTVRVGVSVLDPQEQKSITNFDELSRIFPTVDDALIKGEDVLLFLSRTEYLKAPDPDYEAVGYGVISNTNQVRWKGFPGELADTTSDLEIATQSYVIARYKTPGRNSKPNVEVVVPDVPAEGRPPIASELDDHIGIGAARPLAGALEEAGNEGAIAAEGEGTDTSAVELGLELDDARTAARTATLAVALNDG